MKKFTDTTYVYKGPKRLRRGYTTGTCAAAASKAAAIVLLGGMRPDQVTVDTPAGISLTLETQWVGAGEGWACCRVRKDGGDDPDATHGLWIESRVISSPPLDGQKEEQECYTHITEDNSLYLTGKVGVGIVTLPGLSCQVGKSAINPVPQQMIFSHVEQVCRQYGYKGRLRIEISVPEGEQAAKKTMNSRMGILGGISILGTTGIVEPMSEQALTETIRLELRQQHLAGRSRLMLTPGNYGADFIQNQLGLNLDLAVKCSNFIGKSLDLAAEEGIREVLLIGHGGKLIKLAAGIMDTHSSNADGRMEILGAYAGAAGAGSETIRQVLAAVTVDQALDLLDEREGTELTAKVMKRALERIEFYLKHREGESLSVEAVVFTCKRGIMGMTSGAKAMLEKITRETRQQED